MTSKEQNIKIKELALLISNNNDDNKIQLNELLTLLMPKLQFYIFKFFKHDVPQQEDVLMNTLYKITVNLWRYNNNYSFLTWAFRIAKNEALTVIFENGKLDDSTDVNNELLFNVITEDDLGNKEMLIIHLNTLYKIIEGMDELYSYILIDVLKHNFTMEELSVKYKMNENTIKTRKRKGLQYLKKIVENDYPTLYSDIMDSLK